MYLLLFLESPCFYSSAFSSILHFCCENNTVHIVLSLLRLGTSIMCSLDTHHAAGSGSSLQGAPDTQKYRHMAPCALPAGVRPLLSSTTHRLFKSEQIHMDKQLKYTRWCKYLTLASRRSEGSAGLWPTATAKQSEQIVFQLSQVFAEREEKPLQVTRSLWTRKGRTELKKKNIRMW